MVSGRAVILSIVMWQNKLEQDIVEDGFTSYQQNVYLRGLARMESRSVVVALQSTGCKKSHTWNRVDSCGSAAEYRLHGCKKSAT